jgi:hypothetical protein
MNMNLIIKLLEDNYGKMNKPYHLVYNDKVCLDFNILILS